MADGGVEGEVLEKEAISNMEREKRYYFSNTNTPLGIVKNY